MTWFGELVCFLQSQVVNRRSTLDMMMFATWGYNSRVSSAAQGSVKTLLEHHCRVKGPQPAGQSSRGTAQFQASGVEQYLEDQKLGEFQSFDGIFD